MAAPIHLVTRRPAPPDTQHRCPASVCRLTIPGFKLLCKAHWGMVPASTRRAWQHAQAAGNQAAMRRLAAEAVAAVEAKIARQS